MDPTAAQNFLNSFLNLWILPEIEARKKQKNGEFVLNKAQVIFTIDGKKVVRLNDEVKAKIISNKGREILDMSINTYAEDESIERLDRLPEEQEFGHTTIVKIRDLWVMAFDFRYSASSSKEYFDLANEFLKAANFCFEDKSYKAAASNLFVAMENLMKARIFLYPDSDIRKGKRHPSVAARVNIHAKQTKIVGTEQAKAFNYIKKLYDQGVRYVPHSSIDVNKVKACLVEADNLCKEIRRLYQLTLAFKE